MSRQVIIIILFIFGSAVVVDNMVIKRTDASKSSTCNDYNKIYTELLLTTKDLIKNMNKKVFFYQVSFLYF